MIVWVQVPSPAYAEVAELADAHGSGPCGSDTMRVQVPLSASHGGDRKVAAFVVYRILLYLV